MKSTKYTIYRNDGKFCGLSIKDEKVDETDPKRIVLPIHFRPLGEIEKLDISEYVVKENNGSRVYTIVGIDRSPVEPELYIEKLP